MEVNESKAVSDKYSSDFSTKFKDNKSCIPENAGVIHDFDLQNTTAPRSLLKIIGGGLLYGTAVVPASLVFAALGISATIVAAAGGLAGGIAGGIVGGVVGALIAAATGSLKPITEGADFGSSVGMGLGVGLPFAAAVIIYATTAPVRYTILDAMATAGSHLFASGQGKDSRFLPHIKNHFENISNAVLKSELILVNFIKEKCLQNHRLNKI